MKRVNNLMWVTGSFFLLCTAAVAQEILTNAAQDATKLGLPASEVSAQMNVPTVPAGAAVADPSAKNSASASGVWARLIARAQANQNKTLALVDGGGSAYVYVQRTFGVEADPATGGRRIVLTYSETGLGARLTDTFYCDDQGTMVKMESCNIQRPHPAKPTLSAWLMSVLLPAGQDPLQFENVCVTPDIKNPAILTRFQQEEDFWLQNGAKAK